MDFYQKLTSSLEPLAGELLIDRFLEALRAGAAGRPAGAPRRPRPRAAAAPRQRAAPAEAAPLTDTGKLRLEVEAFLRRGEAADTNDDEIREFLRERAGFDPSDLD